jgi:hypothetical protein
MKEVTNYVELVIMNIDCDGCNDDEIREDDMGRAHG